MLKITSIIASFIFLLFIGTGSYAHTLVNQNQQKTLAKKDKQEKEENSSENGDLEDEHNGPVYRIDLFQAFSLVNVQLRWKDFHEEKNEKPLRAFSKKSSVELRQTSDVTEFFNGNLAIADLPASNHALYISLEGSIETNVSPFPRSLKNQAKTIAYILNCGTYPHGQS